MPSLPVDLSFILTDPSAMSFMRRFGDLFKKKRSCCDSTFMKHCAIAPRLVTIAVPSTIAASSEHKSFVSEVFRSVVFVLAICLIAHSQGHTRHKDRYVLC